MDKSDIRAAVLSVMTSVAPETDPILIEPDRPLHEALDLDSLDWLNVVEMLQARLGVDITGVERSRISTLDALVDVLAEHVSDAQPVPASPPASGSAAAPLPDLQWLVGERRVGVRPIVREDAALEAAFVRQLSDDSRYMRFMSTIDELSPRKLAELTDVDQVGHVALAATVDGDGGPAFVGVARYIVDKTGRSCEFAIAIDDAWHGSGLAGRLMHSLIGVARSRGLATMECDVLRSNRKMLLFARQLGFVARGGAGERDTAHLVLAL